MNKNNYALIMAGGIGSRFWPVSRTEFPKQFIDFFGTGKTLIQSTYDRFLKICPPENIFIVTNEMYTSIIKEQLPDIQDNQILAEPIMRNTAPCVAYGSMKIAQINPDATIVVAPSDHTIANQDKFIAAIEQSLLAAANNDCLITLGIQPSRPDTGYGYIQYTDTVLPSDTDLRKVKLFTEKPNIDLAKSFLQSGDFYGMQGSLSGQHKRSIMLLKSIYLKCTKFFFREKRHIIHPMKQPLSVMLTSNALISPLILPSWKKQIMYMCCRQSLAGLTWVPGLLFMKWQKRIM